MPEPKYSTCVYYGLQLAKNTMQRNSHSCLLNYSAGGHVKAAHCSRTATAVCPQSVYLPEM